MSIDTATKRHSVLGTCFPWWHRPPLPNGDTLVRLSDRQTLCGMYAGLAGSAPLRNIAIFGLFAVVPRLQLASLDIFAKVVTPILTSRPVVLFKEGVTFQEKPVPNLPAVTQDYQLAPIPVFPIADTSIIPPPVIPGPTSSFTEGWELVAATTPLVAGFTEGWELVTTPLVVQFIEGWEVVETALRVSYTELWNV